MEMTLFLLLSAGLLVSIGHAFVVQSGMRRVTNSRVTMGVGDEVVIVGVAGGFGESLACRLVAEGAIVTTVLDRVPVSPLLRDSAKAGKLGLYISEDIEKDGDIVSFVPGVSAPASITTLLQGKTVVAVGDEGDSELRGNPSLDDGFGRMVKRTPNPALPLLGKLLKKLPDGVKGISLCISVKDDDESAGMGLGASTITNIFGGSPSSGGYRKWSQDRQKPFTLFRYGTASGGVQGREPLPFVGLPALEPELHPSYSMQSMIMTRAFSDQYTAEAVCTRDTLTQAVALSLNRDAVEALLVSVPGPPASPFEWDRAFKRLSSLSSSELLRVDFSDILKQKAFVTWIADSWFPQALIDANVATVLRGARPVRAVRVGDDRVEIRWEELTTDLQAKAAGGMEIRLDAEQKALIVTRLSAGSLPGEVELVDRLLEGLNTAYKRNLVSPQK